MVKGMYATHYYNDEPIDPGFTQDMYSNLFGGSRLRQLRIKDRKFASLFKILLVHSGTQMPL